MARPRKLLHGFGLNDADYVVRQHNSTTCPFYLTWANMIKRCYSESFKKTNPSYSQANVCEEWSRFSVFKKWMIEQDWVGKSLDKDLLSDSLIYSPETCIFVDPFINSFLTEKKRKQSKYPTGVLRVTNGKYRALIAERNNGNRWLGKVTLEEINPPWVTQDGFFITHDGYTQSGIRVHNVIDDRPWVTFPRCWNDAILIK